ncbi:MAG: pyruvate kinase alpha/beta domain-containing protein [Nitrososphaerota archaeon]|nr:hypothetical protein [Candidatus Bathyarchaeota archaeon]MDW8048218.1 pyruvate kinase alpha/beta domain-containing protein [Nitrososphaerota archaeon]
MVKVDRVIYYFLEPGPENTEDVLKAVAKRLEVGDVKTVVVASTSGNTGAKFARALKGKAKVIAVSHEKMENRFKDEIVGLGGIAIDKTHLPLHGRGMDKVRDALYSLGQGFKVAVEVILIAADKGVIKPCEDVIGVGGSGEGSDTAIVSRSTTTKEAFGRDSSSKLEVREIIAMPLKKKWWD